MNGYVKVRLPDGTTNIIQFAMPPIDAGGEAPYVVGTIPAGSTVLDCGIPGFTDLPGIMALKAMGRDETDDRI